MKLSFPPKADRQSVVFNWQVEYIFISFKFIPLQAGQEVLLKRRRWFCFVDLNFIEKVGERTESLGGRREPIYSFNRSPKTEINLNLFTYCLNEFFTQNHPNEKSLSFTEICVGPGSPGQIFKLSESDIREYLLKIQKQTGAFSFKESAALQHVFLSKKMNPQDLLGRIYNN